jgi:predicted peptidase
VKVVRQLPLTIGNEEPYQTAAASMPRIPIWIFHGSEDAVIPATESRKMFTELKQIGADVRYTEYSGVDHNSWDRAYSEKKLWEWMLKQSRN